MARGLLRQLAIGKFYLIMLALILILIGYNVVLTVALLQHGKVHEELNYEIRVVKGYENYVDNALEIL